jgi:hypothetical protein
MKNTGLYILFICILIMTGCGKKVDKDRFSGSSGSEDEEISLPENIPPRALFGKLNEDKVRIRTAPTLHADITGELTLGEEVQVLCRTSETYAIAGMEDYWYVIKRTNGTVGWSYGYYISFNEPVDNAIYIHYVDYSDEVKFEDRKWVGDYYAYRVLNKHTLPEKYIEQLQKTDIRITLDEIYALSIGYHPDIDESGFVLLRTMNQMDGFTVNEYETGRIAVSFINNYVVVAGETLQDSQTYTYEIYYVKKKD